MGLYSRAIVGLVVAIVGCLPAIEVLTTGSYRRRGDPLRTTRQDDPIGYWTIAIATTLLAMIALATGVAIWRGLIKP